MRDSLTKELFVHLERVGEIRVGRCDRELERSIEALSLPLEVKRLLQWQWPVTGGPVGPYTLFSVAEVFLNDDWRNLHHHNMLPIGYANNGDPLVLFFPEDKTCQVGLLNHDDYWEEECEPRMVYFEVTATVEEFLLRAAEGSYLPIDSYAAEEWLSLKNEMGDARHLVSADPGPRRRPPRSAELETLGSGRVKIHMATFQTAWKKSDGPVRYFQSDREIQLGDRIELRGFLRKRRGSVNYVPGISNPHPEMEHNALFWVGVAFDNGTFSGALVDPDTGCTRKQVGFIERGSSDAMASLPEAPWE